MTKEKFSFRNGRIQFSNAEKEIFAGNPFTSIFFDGTVPLWRVGALLPPLLSEFEQKHHVRIESVTTVVSGEQQGTLLLLRHTSPQDGKQPLM